MHLLRFADHLTPRPQPTGIDVVTQLHHFAIITYAVDPLQVTPHLHPRFVPDTVQINGQTKGLLSVVPFLDVDFTSAVYPFPKLKMGQTNYRIYVRDQETGEQVVWFLGTTLDSWAIFVPRLLWQLPWHKGRIGFRCEVDPRSGLYQRYQMVTESDWAPAMVSLTQPAELNWALPGFPDQETGLVFLTHPLKGFYYRRDRQLGGYNVWHGQLAVQPAVLQAAHFQLLEWLNLVSQEEQQTPHSVLLAPAVEFTVYLPPHKV